MKGEGKYRREKNRQESDAKKATEKERKGRNGSGNWEVRDRRGWGHTRSLHPLVWNPKPARPVSFPQTCTYSLVAYRWYCKCAYIGYAWISHTVHVQEAGGPGERLATDECRSLSGEDMRNDHMVRRQPPVAGWQRTDGFVNWHRSRVKDFLHAWTQVRTRRILTPATPAVPKCCCSKGSAPYWTNRL